MLLSKGVGIWYKGAPHVARECSLDVTQVGLAATPKVLFTVGVTAGSGGVAVIKLPSQ